MTQRDVTGIASGILLMVLLWTACALASPIVPNASAENASESAMPQQKPLLVIRFNKEHIYFQHALRLAVDSTEKAKPGAQYRIVSYVPSGNNRQQNERINANAGGNLNDVVQAMQNLGIPPLRIQVTSQNASALTAQEIHIFVE